MGHNAINRVPFAQGRTAEIYEWEPGTILKLYRDWCPPDWAERESRAARAVFNAGIQTPDVVDLVELEGRRGIVYQRVDGPSMLQEMGRRPWTLFRYARALAEMQAQYVKLRIPGLMTYRDELWQVIARTEHLPAELRQPVLEQLKTLPEGETLCHGDFHPANVLVTPQGLVIIDWMTARSGSSWADVARTRLLLTIGPKGVGKGDGNQASVVLLMFVGLFFQIYFKRVRELIPDALHECDRWLPVLAAARLEERIAPERSALLELVYSSLKQWAVRQHD